MQDDICYDWIWSDTKRLISKSVRVVQYTVFSIHLLGLHRSKWKAFHCIAQRLNAWRYDSNETKLYKAIIIKKHKHCFKGVVKYFRRWAYLVSSWFVVSLSKNLHIQIWLVNAWSRVFVVCRGGTVHTGTEWRRYITNRQTQTESLKDSFSRL